MGFRDGFSDGFMPGFRADKKQLQSLCDDLSSTFQAGISRLEYSQTQSAKMLQKEMQYQAGHIVEAVDRGSADVVAAVQNACDYLGGQLSEVRWAIDRQTQVSLQVLQVLVHALDNTSRQYWEQGVRCYETAEYDMAKERFARSLDANPTNYFAYQYLGFIAVHREAPHEAIKNFDLARKFAQSGYDRALALSHLARSQKAIGDLPQAIRSSVAATDSAPGHARFWYERAVFHVSAENAGEAIACLRRAIEADWMYWSISASDGNLESIRESADGLLAEMREERRAIARQNLDRFADALNLLDGMRIAAEVSDWRRNLDECEAMYREGTVFAFRNLVEPSLDGRSNALRAGMEVLDRRLNVNRAALSQAQAEQRQDMSKAGSGVSDVEREARQKESSYKGRFGFFGCVGLIVIFLPMLLMFNLMVSARQPFEKLWGTCAFFALLPIFVVFMLKDRILRYLRATLPAGRIRARIPELQRELERAKTESEARLAQTANESNQELERLKRQKEQCQGALRA